MTNRKRRGGFLSFLSQGDSVTATRRSTERAREWHVLSRWTLYRYEFVVMIELIPKARTTVYDSGRVLHWDNHAGDFCERCCCCCSDRAVPSGPLTIISEPTEWGSYPFRFNPRWFWWRVQSHIMNWHVVHIVKIDSLVLFSSSFQNILFDVLMC